jgi:hypothetical protein
MNELSSHNNSEYIKGLNGCILTIFLNASTYVYTYTLQNKINANIFLPMIKQSVWVRPTISKESKRSMQVEYFLYTTKCTVKVTFALLRTIQTKQYHILQRRRRRRYKYRFDTSCWLILIFDVGRNNTTAATSPPLP